MNDTRERLIRCFAAVFDDVDEKEIPNLEAKNTKGWDSLAFVMLMNLIQQEFSVEIPLEEMETMDSFETMYNGIVFILRSKC